MLGKKKEKKIPDKKKEIEIEDIEEGDEVIEVKETKDKDYSKQEDNSELMITEIYDIIKKYSGKVDPRIILYNLEKIRDFIMISIIPEPKNETAPNNS